MDSDATYPDVEGFETKPINTQLDSKVFRINIQNESDFQNWKMHSLNKHPLRSTSLEQQKNRRRQYLCNVSDVSMEYPKGRSMKLTKNHTLGKCECNILRILFLSIFRSIR